MNGLRQVVITGTGSFVLPHIVTNKDLEARMDTTDEWIRKRTGIEQRHHVLGPEGPADLALKSSENALAAAGRKPQDLDLIIFATLAADYYFPGSSALLQAKLGLETTPAMDIRCQCSGFIYGMNIAKLFIATGQYNRVLVVGSEVHSTVLDFSNEGRDVSVLFGDGSGAAIFEATDDAERGIKSTHLYADGAHADKLCIKKPGTLGLSFFCQEDIDRRDTLPYMDGRYVFKHVVKRLKECVEEALRVNQLSADQIDHFLFHQANLRINEAVADLMKIDQSKMPSNIQRFGNCSAALIPMLLDESVRSGRIKKGDLVCLASFGAGFTWASAIIRW